MRKVIIAGLMAATLAPTIASAQSAGEVRRDRQDLRQEQRELRDAQMRGDRRDIREERRDVRDAHRELREDWQDYRRTHRDAFRGPAYVGPRGWAYRPVTPGYRLTPNFYGQRYVIADPYRYRLRPAAGPLRWVRYGNDVLLVNVRTGRVMEVHREFFW